MPSIPTLSGNQINPRALPGVQVANIRETGGISIGQGLSDAGDVVSKIQIEERQKADRAAFMEADTATSELNTRLLLDPEKGARTRQGKDAIGSTDEYLKQFDEESTRISNGLKNDRQKTAYNESRMRRREQLSADLNAHELRERESYYEQTRKAYEQSAYDTAITHHSNPKAIEAEVANIEASVRSTPGLDDETKSALITEKRSNVYAGVIDRYLANDEIAAAEQYYKGVKERIGGNALTQIEANIRAAKNRAESRRDSELAILRQELSDELSDVDAAFKSRIPITSIPSETRTVQLLGEQRGRRVYKEALAKQQASIRIAELDNMDTEGLVKADQQYKPTTQKDAATNAEVYSTVGRAVADIMTERSKDPVGYLQARNPAVSAAYQRFNENPNDATRAEYLSALQGNKERLGIAGNEILSKAEESAVVDRMTKQTDSISLVNSIASEQARWGADFGRVFQQVGKDLPDTAYLIPNVSEKAANILATVSQQSNDELKKTLGDMPIKDVEDRIARELGELRQSFPIEGAPAYSKIESATTKLAIGFVAQGMSPKNAIRAAVDEVTRNHAFTKFRDHVYRIPAYDETGRPLDSRAVEIGAMEYLRTFQAGENLIPKGSLSGMHVEVERLTEKIKRDGYWVTAPDESGLVLFLDYQPVGDPPISYSWEQLKDVAATYRKEREAEQEARQSVEFVP